MKKEKYEWVVLKYDCQPNRLICERCGKVYEMPSGPQPFSIFTAIADVFLKTHKRCKDKHLPLLLIVSFLLIGSMGSVMGFSIDSDDTFYLKRGEKIEGRFIVEGYSPDMIVKSNMEWISLDENKYISERPISGIPVIDDNYYVSYWISVPEGNDIGVYRGTISVQRGTETRYLNVKMSVQNGFVTLVFKSFDKPIVKVIGLVGGVLVVGFIVYLTFKGAKNGKR